MVSGEEHIHVDVQAIMISVLTRQPAHGTHAPGPDANDFQVMPSARATLWATEAGWAEDVAANHWH